MADSSNKPAGRFQDCPAGWSWRTFPRRSPNISPTYSFDWNIREPSKSFVKEVLTFLFALAAFLFSLYNFVFETLRGADLRFGEQKTVGLFFETCSRYDGVHPYLRAWIDLQLINVGGAKSTIFLRPRSATLSYGNKSATLNYHFSARTERYLGTEAHCHQLADGSTVYAADPKNIMIGKRDFSTIYALDSGKSLLTEMFFAPRTAKDVVSKDGLLAEITPNSTIKLSFNFDFSENFNFLTWLGLDSETKQGSVSCVIDAKEEVISVFKDRGFFSVGNNYAKCTTNNLKRILMTS